MASTANRHAPSEQASLDRLLDDFLTDHEQVVNSNVFAGRPTPLVPRLVFLGRGGHPLEVALASAPLGRPKVDDVRRLWAERHANRPAPLLLVVAYPDGDEARATLCGPVGDAPPVESGLDLSQVERLCAAALREPSRHAAVRLLAGMLDGLRAELIPGLRNAGLLATQELKAGVPQRADWRPATDRGKRMLALRGRPLLEALGFCVETLSTTTTALTARVSRRAVALLLDEGEGFEEPGRALQSHRPRFAGSRRSRTPRTPRGHPHPQSSGPALLGSPGRRRRTPGAAPKPTSKSTSRCCLTTQPATCRCCWAPTRWLMVARSSRSSPAPPTSP